MTTVAAFRERLSAAMAADPRPMAVVARHAGVSHGCISAILRGKQRSPTLETVDAISGALGLSTAWMLGFEDGPLTGPGKAPRLRDDLGRWIAR